MPGRWHSSVSLQSSSSLGRNFNLDLVKSIVPVHPNPPWLRFQPLNLPPPFLHSCVLGLIYFSVN